MRYVTGKARRVWLPWLKRQQDSGAILMHIHQPDDLDREAIELNKASEDALPMTFVDYAELVWKRLADGQTQQAVADSIGWSREAVKNYASLKKIASPAWELVGTAFQVFVPDDEEGAVPVNGTDVPKTPFSENLLRNILPLRRKQQVELCRGLAGNKITKEIAELTGKRHDHVLRDVDNLLKTLPPELGTGFSMTYEGDPAREALGR